MAPTLHHIEYLGRASRLGPVQKVPNLLSNIVLPRGLHALFLSLSLPRLAFFAAAQTFTRRLSLPTESHRSAASTVPLYY